MNELTCKVGSPVSELNAFKHSLGLAGKTGWVAFLSQAMKALVFGTYSGDTARPHKVKVMFMFPEVGDLMLKNTERCARKA